MYGALTAAAVSATSTKASAISETVKTPAIQNPAAERPGKVFDDKSLYFHRSMVLEGLGWHDFVNHARNLLFGAGM
jgi:hypothetical protein